MRAMRESSRRSAAAEAISWGLPFAHERSCVCALAPVIDACVRVCNECMGVHVCVGRSSCTTRPVGGLAQA